MRKWLVGLQLSPGAWLGAALLGLFVLAALVGPLVAPYSPTVGDLDERMLSPSPAHWLGTDENGVDLLSAEVYYLEDLPTQVRPLEVLQIGGIALALAIAATFYPALSAARQPPAEALRYE